MSATFSKIVRYNEVKFVGKLKTQKTFALKLVKILDSCFLKSLYFGKN